jgi:hypothetical protein
LDFLEEFYNKGVLPKAVNASFLTLIPKGDHPQRLMDYRPICLIGCIYKILSELLANRLKGVIGKLISKNQTGFVPGRQILDRVLLVNELIDLAKRREDRALLFKVDFEKTYGSVNWKYLEFVLRKMKFLEKW